MDEETIELVRGIVREELAKSYKDRRASTAPDCTYCTSENTHWMGGSRMRCRDCGKTKTIRVAV